MSKVITFSRRFLKGHPRAGAPTYFVEKIAASLSVVTDTDYYPCLYPLREFMALPDFNPREYWAAKPKRHTIREGKRWSAGQYFSPRFWAGAPYRSKQTTICADVRIERVYDFVIEPGRDERRMFINGRRLNAADIQTLATNDGLTLNDFLEWMPAALDGQIICWSDMVNY